MVYSPNYSPMQTRLVAHRGQAKAVRIDGGGSDGTYQLGTNHTVIGRAESLGASFPHPVDVFRIDKR